MPLYEYECCERFFVTKGMDKSSELEICPKCGQLAQRIYTPPRVTGTRDSFGIGKEFKDKDGRVIDNWKSWERAGYKDARDVTTGEAKRQVERKIEKIEKYDTKKRFSVRMGK